MHKILTMILFLPVISMADVADNKKHEVLYLLNFIQQSGCEMSRNGSNHSGEDAVAHIQKKYDYFRKDVESTEDFIRLSATKSTMSGKYYTVKCNGREIGKTKDWLLKELAVYRMKRRF